MTDWREAIDAYCERTSPDFWAEPVNALTNAAFVLAALAVLRATRAAAANPAGSDAPRGPGAALPASIIALCALMVAIGIGSFLFHTVATRWAALADVVPIYLFMHLYAACFARWMLGLRWRSAWLGAPAFTLFALAVAGVVPDWVRSLGVTGYFPAWLVLLGFAATLAARADPAWRAYAAAALLFGGSLTLRQLDEPWCADWPLGTHFAWHLLNAATLYVVTRALAQRARAPHLSAGR